MPQRFGLTSVGFDPFEDGLPEAGLSPRERLELLADPGSLHTFRSGVLSRPLGNRAKAGDGVIAATGSLGDRPIVCYAQDASVLGGSLGEMHADTIVRAMGLARDGGVPIVGFWESGGARMQEGPSALNAYARIFAENVALSGHVPQISVVTGPSAGGASYSTALTDFVVMVAGSRMFLTGPAVVREACGEDVTAEELGGTRVHSRTGVAHFAVPTDIDAIFLVRELLSYLPFGPTDPPTRVESAPPLLTDPGSYVPASPRKVYDVRKVIAACVDKGKLLEMSPRWARNVVTGLARLDGWAVGVLANQPHHLGGVLDVQSSQKAARFVRTCNTFGLPILVFVDTPGFMPGTKQELGGAIRHGAKMLYAFAEATVPRITVVLRKAYGGAFISMNGKDLGADLTLGWPGAEIGIMGVGQAITILHRREIEASDDPGETRRGLTERYTIEQDGVGTAMRDGVIDEVIDPSETRHRLAGALKVLMTRKVRPAHTGNIPL